MWGGGGPPTPPEKKRGKKYLGNPLILNGYVSGGKEVIDGEKVKKAGKTSILDRNGDELIIAPEKETINEMNIHIEPINLELNMDIDVTKFYNFII